MAPNFQIFMAAVNRLLTARIGMRASDLEDYCWRDAYNDATTPEDAVEDFLQEYRFEYPVLELVRARA